MLPRLSILVLACGVAGGTAAAACAQTVSPSYGWPVKPFFRPHAVRGAFGDPREISATRRVLHFGIDVAARDGTPVYAVAAGVVHLRGGRSVAIAVDGDRHAFGYWHVVPVVRGGQRVGRHQLLGHVAKGWGHLHFSERLGGGHVNPLRPGGLGPYADRSQPRLRGVRFERRGRAVSGPVRGRIDIVAEAFDLPAVGAPPPWDDARVAPALVRWRIVESGLGTAGSWRSAYDVRLRLPSTPFEAVYAPGTRQQRRDVVGRYRFYLARAWESDTLADGAYVLEVAAADTRANEVRARYPFTVRNSRAVGSGGG